MQHINKTDMRPRVGGIWALVLFDSTYAKSYRLITNTKFPKCSLIFTYHIPTKIHIELWDTLHSFPEPSFA